jgi:hypothetical protein
VVEPVRQARRRREPVGAAARVAEHREALEAEVVGEHLDVGVVVEDAPVRPVGGQPHPRPVGRDQPHPPLGGRVVQGVAVEPAARRAVEEQQRKSVGGAVLGPPERAAVGQQQRLAVELRGAGDARELSHQATARAARST